ncbi:carbon starvation CstA family protein [Sinomicrobium weinanense]|uniref:Carbon starvation protein A n=1 Tax=Sinomicrobium weinanense TaxID=2842200 RepID=A0A926JW88_9FLAO|nr:carbon starvation protein A [Sinomicrobium weinanense]MBC9798529.1 carbon starvation protein A [Sinomicrobium weinanense]MBU3125828.1 carbon starvation protein A [Sinomicrobium weinanense]
MVSFLISMVVLVIGYFVYGTIVEKVFGINPGNKTPAVKFNDKVDFVPLPAWKVFLIQFLNIAGLGPIFGAIAGAMFGPAAFIWIVVGSIFAGGVHDYLSGMLSVRHNGLSISEIVGVYLGKYLKQVMRVFIIVLLIFVGTVFLVGPAKIIAEMFQNGWGTGMWIAIILVYYILSTLLPIDKIISKLYPLFGIAMLIMAIGLIIALFSGVYHIPEITGATMRNMTINPEKTSLFPILFVTIACGAISGFHATQSPLMSRCIRSEKEGKKIFFGAMITEGIVALIWAAAAMAFFGNVEGLNFAMADHENNAAWAAHEITNGMLGNIGGILAVIGLVAAPITSGDTAFRSARLILADIFNYDQKLLKKRLLMSGPLFIIALILSQIEFGIIWRYFAWSNQVLAMVVLWTVTAYLMYKDKLYIISLVPAIFMTLVCSTYILLAPEGFELNHILAYGLGILITVAISLLFWNYAKRKRIPGITMEIVE